MRNHYIGTIDPRSDGSAKHVLSASKAGVGLASEATSTLEPWDARTMAALLVRAADECERMRSPTAPELLEAFAELLRPKDGSSNEIAAGGRKPEKSIP
jgi:hypothetical protein